MGRVSVGDWRWIAVVQQNLLRAEILQNNSAGSEAGAGSEAKPKILFLSEALQVPRASAQAGPSVETEADEIFGITTDARTRDVRGHVTSNCPRF